MEKVEKKKMDSVEKSVHYFLRGVKSLIIVILFYFFLGMVSSFALSHGAKLPYLPFAVGSFVGALTWTFLDAMFSVLLGIYVNTRDIRDRQ